MARSTRRSSGQRSSQITAATTARPSATNSSGESEILSSDLINDDFTAMVIEGTEGTGTARDLHHADVLRAMFYNSNATFDERLPPLSGEWAVPNYTDEEGLDILRSIHRRRQQTEPITPVLATELPSNKALARYREAGLIGSSEEHEDRSGNIETDPPTSVALNDDPVLQTYPSQDGHGESLSSGMGKSQPDPSHTAKAPKIKQRDPFKIFLRIDRKTYPAHDTPAPDRLQYNDSDRNIGSLPKAQGVVQTSFEGIGAHTTIVPRSLLTKEERPASVAGLVRDVRIPVQTEEDFDAYLAGEVDAYARATKELDAEAKKDTAAKWALMKKEAKRIAPPKKIAPVPKTSRAKEKLRKSARHRHDSVVPALSGTTPPLEEQSAATDFNTSSQQSRSSSQQLIANHEVEKEFSTSGSLVSARGQTTSNNVVSDSTTSDGKDPSEPVTAALRSSIAGPQAGMMTTRAQKRKREVTEHQPGDIDLQGADHHSSKRARVLHSSEAIESGKQEPSSSEGTEQVQAPDANIVPAVPTGTSSLSTFASGRKRDGAGRFQGNKDTVLGSSGTARVSKTRSKKRSR